MKQILEKFTKVEIAKMTGKGYTTVLGWFKRNSMPTGDLDALDFEIRPKKEKFYTSDEVKYIIDAFKDNRHFGPSTKIKRK